MQNELSGFSGVLDTDGRFDADNRLYVEFYVEAVHNTYKSAQEGRPIYDEVEFVKIQAPGDRLSSVVQKVNDLHKRRFPKQWAQFQNGQKQAVSGTPLEMWPQMTVGMVASLKAMNITTVEQLAELSDGNASQIMGNHELRRKAKNFLEAAAGESVNTKMEAELKKRDDEIALLKAQMEQLLAPKSDKQAKAT